MYVTDWETPYEGLKPHEAHGAFPLTSSAIVGADDFWRRKPPRDRQSVAPLACPSEPF